MHGTCVLRFLFRKATYSCGYHGECKAQRHRTPGQQLALHRDLGGNRGLCSRQRGGPALRQVSSSSFAHSTKLTGIVLGTKGNSSQSLPTGAPSTSETGANSRHDMAQPVSPWAQAQCVMGLGGTVPWKRRGPRAHLEGERAQGSPPGLGLALAEQPLLAKSSVSGRLTFPSTQLKPRNEAEGLFTPALPLCVGQRPGGSLFGHQRLCRGRTRWVAVGQGAKDTRLRRRSRPPATAHPPALGTLSTHSLAGKVKPQNTSLHSTIVSEKQASHGHQKAPGGSSRRGHVSRR